MHIHSSLSFGASISKANGPDTFLPFNSTQGDAVTQQAKTLYQGLNGNTFFENIPKSDDIDIQFDRVGKQISLTAVNQANNNEPVGIVVIDDIVNGGTHLSDIRKMRNLITDYLTPEKQSNPLLKFACTQLKKVIPGLKAN